MHRMRRSDIDLDNIDTINASYGW